jgi:hypothetical protein
MFEHILPSLLQGQILPTNPDRISNNDKKFTI